MTGPCISQCGNGCQYALVAGRYNLMTGPCITVDTACSSSMSALSMAVNDLQCGNCQYALVAGRYNLMTGPCITVDTACSSSMSALSMAVNDLQCGNCQYALVAGRYSYDRPLYHRGHSL